MNPHGRPPVRIRFHFNIATGESEFIVDDLSPDRTDAYHDQVARAIARFLSRNPEIRDAGPIRYPFDREWQRTVERYERELREQPPETQAN